MSRREPQPRGSPALTRTPFTTVMFSFSSASKVTRRVLLPPPPISARRPAGRGQGRPQGDSPSPLPARPATTPLFIGPPLAPPRPAGVEPCFLLAAGPSPWKPRTPGCGAARYPERQRKLFRQKLDKRLRLQVPGSFAPGGGKGGSVAPAQCPLGNVVLAVPRPRCGRGAALSAASVARHGPWGSLGARPRAEGSFTIPPSLRLCRWLERGLWARPSPQVEACAEASSHFPHHHSVKLTSV